MDPDKPSSNRKHRFTPKAPTQRKTRSKAVPKIEKAENSDDVEIRQQLLQRFETGNRRHQSKVEDKVQATFIHGGKRSATTWGSDAPQDVGLKQSSEDLMDLDDFKEQSVVSPARAGPSMPKKSLGDDSSPENNEYKEPWNYAHTYYPTTLPWRRPYSGNPDILDEAEFGEAAMKVEYDENAISPASELGFLNPDEKSEDVRLLFLQFPPSLPVIKRYATAKGKEIADTPGTSGHKGSKAMHMGAKGSTASTSQRTCSLEDLSAGHMGKLLVYKSGAVKLKLGGTLYDVSPGSDCSFAQDLVAINTKEKECCSIGNLDKRAIVTPDTEYLLNSVIDLG